MYEEMRDTKLLAKLSVGDMTASDALYHKKCHTALHTRYRSFVRKNTKGSGNSMQSESIALVELTSYLEEMKCVDGKYILFRLVDLMKLYRGRLTQLGGDSMKRPNSTHTKNKLLERLPQLEEHSSIREVVLSFNGTLVNDQYKNSPKSLASLMQMILAGTNIQNQTASTEDVSLSAQSLTQLVTFKTLK